MATSKGNWFSNQEEVSDKIQNLDSDGNLTGDVTGDLTGVATGAATAYDSVTPAISLADKSVDLDASSNAVAATLANGTNGQTILFWCEDASNAVTLVPATLWAGTTITFDVNETALLEYATDAGWIMTGGTAALT